MKILITACVLALSSALQAPAWASSIAPNLPRALPHVIGNCQFRATEVEGGRFSGTADDNRGGYTIGYDSDPGYWAVFLSCEKLEPGLLEERAGIRKEGEMYVISDSQGQFIREQHAKFVPLDGKNLKGGGTLTDSTTGEPFNRYKRLHFCLVHDSHALCGWSDVVTHLSVPNKSTLKKVLRLLNSIEFTDDSVTSEVKSPTVQLHDADDRYFDLAPEAKSQIVSK